MWCGWIGSFPPPPFSKAGVVLEGLLISLSQLLLASAEDVNCDKDACFCFWVMAYSMWWQRVLRPLQRWFVVVFVAPPLLPLMLLSLLLLVIPLSASLSWMAWFSSCVASLHSSLMSLGIEVVAWDGEDNTVLLWLPAVCSTHSRVLICWQPSLYSATSNPK